ncbi:MAG TPA: ATP-binding protein [archaeon]|nr:ATP-binding protein [archaeon]
MPRTIEDVKKWIDEWEGPTLEFKQSVSGDRIGKTISAFANSAGGNIIFGVSPSKQIVGVRDSDAVSRDLRNLLQSCRPSPPIEEEFLRHEGKTVIILSISAFPFSQNVCFFKKAMFVRQGSVNVEVSGEDLIAFLRNRAVLNFEESKSLASLEDLDLTAIGQLLSRRGTNAPSREELRSSLVGLSLATMNGSFSLKNVAVVFFAKEPARLFANLQVRIVRFRGTEADVGNIASDAIISGTVPHLIAASFDEVKRLVGATQTLEGPRRISIRDYPEDALREAITNALGHRDYFEAKDVIIEIFEDRLRITSPGGLLPGQNIQTFDRTPRHRNPVLYRLLHEAGFGEGLGLGVKLMRRRFRERALPDPDFTDFGNAFQVVFYNARSRKKRNLPDFENARQKQALAYLRKHPILKTGDYARMVGVSQPTALGDLNELVKQGKLKKVGSFRGAYYELV